MKVYFVRHGESVLNKEKVHQFSHTPLSDRGIQQAKHVSARLKNIPIDQIFASPFERAKHTAEIIAAPHGITITFSDLLKENKRPSEFEGKKNDAPELVAIKQLLKNNYHDSSFRYKDEETYFDIEKRSQEFEAILESQRAGHIVCVSHGGMITAIISYMMFKEKLTSYIYDHIASFLRLNNTGITVCEFREDSTWKLITWNDTTHIPE